MSVDGSAAREHSATANAFISSSFSPLARAAAEKARETFLIHAEARQTNEWSAKYENFPNCGTALASATIREHHLHLIYSFWSGIYVSLSICYAALCPEDKFRAVVAELPQHARNRTRSGREREGGVPGHFPRQLFRAE